MIIGKLTMKTRFIFLTAESCKQLKCVCHNKSTQCFYIKVNFPPLSPKCWNQFLIAHI